MAERLTGCECSEPGWCERHQCFKTAHWHHLCRTRKDYFQLWEEGRGPGQHVARAEGAERGLPRGPGLGRRVVYFSKAVARHLADKARVVSEEAYRQRLDICRQCDLCDILPMVCHHERCGCRLRVKARWHSEVCPLGKWPALEGEGEAVLAPTPQAERTKDAQTEPRAADG